MSRRQPFVQVLAIGLGLAAVGAGLSAPQAQVPPPAEEKPVELRWRLQDGQPFYQEVTTETTDAMTVLNMEVRQRQAQTFWNQWTPGSKRKGKRTMIQAPLRVELDGEIGGNRIRGRLE